MITVTIADDHQLFAESLASAIRALPDFDVVGVVGDGRALIESLESNRPDLVLLDLDMPGLSALETLALIDNPPPTLIVTMHSDIRPDSEPSIRGVVPKSTPLADLAVAARAVLATDEFITAESIDRLRSRFGSAPVDPLLQALTRRERQLLGLMADGVTGTSELAEQMFISRKTVKNHLANIYEKLAVTDRAQAALEAVRLGLSGGEEESR